MKKGGRLFQFFVQIFQIQKKEDARQITLILADLDQDNLPKSFKISQFSVPYSSLNIPL
jgi:hypothetical protein